MRRAQLVDRRADARIAVAHAESRPGTGRREARALQAAGRGTPAAASAAAGCARAAASRPWSRSRDTCFADCDGPHVEDRRRAGSASTPSARSRRRADPTGTARGSAAPPPASAASGVPRLVSSIADARRAVVREGRLGSVSQTGYRCLRAAPPARRSRAAPPTGSPFSRTASSRASAPFGPSAMRLHRHRLNVSTCAAILPSRNVNCESISLCDRAAGDRERVARLPVRASRRGRRRARRANRATRSLAALAQHRPHVGDLLALRSKTGSRNVASGV